MTETRSKTPSAVRRRRSPGESRQEILDEVVELLWDRPIRDLSIVTIMRGTGLSRPAFYQYFKNVPVLIEELLHDLEAEMHEAATAWFLSEGPANDKIRILRLPSQKSTLSLQRIPFWNIFPPLSVNESGP